MEYINKAEITNIDYFYLDGFRFYNINSFSKDMEKKLSIYNYPYGDGVDIEDRGEGETRLSVSGQLMTWENVANNKVIDYKNLEKQILRNGTKRFIHPELGAFNVAVSSFKISQENDKVINFDIEMSKVTSRRVIKTQLLLEKEFEATTYNNEIVHIVKAGDNLWDLAKKYLGNGKLYRKLIEYNKIKATKSRIEYPADFVGPIKDYQFKIAYYIYPNQKIKIPTV